MNNTVRATTPSLKKAQAMNAALVAADDAVLRAKVAVEDAERRRQPLRDRLQTMDSDGCQHEEFDPALSDALVADPTALPDVEAITAAVSASRKAQDVHEAQRRVIQEAIDKIGLEVATAQANLSAALAERQAAWRAFVNAAHLHLGERMRLEFEALRIDVIEPMLALQSVVDPDRGSVVSQAPRLIGDFEILVRVREDYEALELSNLPMPVPAPPIREAGDTTRKDAVQPEMARVMKTRWHDERLFPVRRREGDQSVDPIVHLRAQLASK